MAQSIVGDKSLAFAKRIAKCYVFLKEEDEVNIALKEAGETDYWLDVIHSANYFSDEEYASLDNDNKELLRMLASIVKTSKEKE